MENIDRVLYAHSIDTAGLDYTSTMVKNFDQFMGVYGFIQPCDYQVKVVGDSGDDLVLDIIFSNPSSIEKFGTLLASFDYRLSVYGRVFTVGILTTVGTSIRVCMHTEQ